MIRNLKALGLALAAVFAMSAVATSVASAQQGTLTSDSSPVTLIAEETGAEANFLKAFGLTVQCPGSKYTGHTYNVTPHVPIVTPATTVTLTPHYAEANENCNVTPGNFKATIDKNGCDYVLHLGQTTGGVADTYGVTADIVCPVGQEITVTVWTNSADLTAKTTPMCTLHVKAQTGLTGPHATDTTNGHIDVSGTFTNIHVLKTKHLHTLLCPEATTNLAEFSIDVTVRGTKGETGGAAVPIRISHP